MAGQAKRYSKEIGEGVKLSRNLLKQMALEGLREEIEAMQPRVRAVMRQTRVRIFRGNTRFEGKLLSLFEPSTEVISKGKAGKPNEFGKMVKLQEAENQIVIDYEVYARRPNDADLLIPAIETHRAKLGRAPYLVAADAAFYSPRTRRQRKPRASSASAFPTAQSRARSAGASNLLFRWFVGLGVDDPVWDYSTFSKNRDRLLEAEVAAKFLEAVLRHTKVKRFLGNEHFSVDGTLIEAWARVTHIGRGI